MISEAVDVTSPVPSQARARALPKITYISWAESCSRSEHTARELAGTSFMVYEPRFGSRPSTILFKYAVQWVRTARILRREQPDTVFVMSPPVFAALPAFWYAWRRRKQVIIDAHTGAFLSRRWRAFQWLQRMLCRRAASTLVSNDYLAGLIRAGGGHATVVPDVPILFPDGERFARPAGFVAAVVSSFDYDEPLAEIFEAAARLPDVTFLMTGNPHKLPRHIAARQPQNLRLTGFLATSAYGRLLADVDVVIVLTTYDHTMLRGAYEAIYQGTPVIVSDWPLLRDAFPTEAAAHVDNTPEALVSAVRTVQANAAAFRHGAKRLREAKLQRWAATKQVLLERIGAA
jgi:glycosyltransferase involved in cell wall biosynthesis